MSEQQQPKEYIITEKELQHAEEHHIKFIDDAKRIRSRPHPAPQALDEMSIRNTLDLLDRVNCGEKCNLESEKCDYTCQKAINIIAEHDAAIERNAREDEREQVLNRAIEKFGEWYDAGFARPVTKEHVIKILESLRHHSEQQEQPR